MVHALCLERLEERLSDGTTAAVPWEEAMDLIEALLAPAARPPHVLALGWRRGDVALFDNRCVQHSVTPTHSNGADPCYAALGETRLLTRTAMHPSWLPRASPPPLPLPSRGPSL